MPGAAPSTSSSALPEQVHGFDLSSVFRTVATTVPEQELLVAGDLRLTYGAVDADVDALARFLAGRGLGCHTERQALAGHESGQDHVGLYLHNGPEYLEAMIASYRARAVRDPRGVLAEWGTVLPEGMEVRVVDSTADYRWMVLPLRPAGTDGWDEARLAAIVTRDALVGVELPKAPAAA